MPRPGCEYSVYWLCCRWAFMHGIGLWAVFTDYLTERLMGTTGNVLRFAAQALCALIMFTYVVWGIQILWELLDYGGSSHNFI